MTMTFDNSPPDGKPRRAGRLRRRSRRARVRRLGKSSGAQAVLRCFESLFGPRAQAAERYLEQDWAAERWSARRAGVELLRPAAGPHPARRCASRSAPIHWAGTETATRWAGYIDGAVSSGERAAAEVARREP